jgi:hypothetical protein
MTHADQLRNIVEQYQIAKGVAVYQTCEVAAWAIQHRLWVEHPAAMVERCATAISRALREDVLAGGVRAKHAVRVVRGGLQLTLWADMRTAPRAHMAESFRQRRQQIAADCRRLDADMNYYNEHFNRGRPIQLSFDFSEDMLAV